MILLIPSPIHQCLVMYVKLMQVGGRSILEEFCRSAGRTVGARAAELAGGFIDDDISSR